MKGFGKIIRPLLLIATVFLLFAGATRCLAGSAVVIGVKVAAAESIPVGRIDHAVWDALLKKYVDPRGMVDYQGWQKSPADLRALDEYLNRLSMANVSMDAEEGAKLAFWINAYNALTVKGILREYPTTSIRNHTAKFFGYNIWDDLQLIVGGKPYSLNQMEHEVLRKMNDPRIHFAIVCASIGCPRLLSEAYMPAKIDKQLTSNAKEFFADPAKFQFDVKNNTIVVSPILDWFSEDFGDTTAEQMQRIAPYVPEAASELASSSAASVNYLDYNWNLNDQAKTAQ